MRETTMRRIQAKSQNRESAVELVNRFVAVVELLHEIDRRGGIVAVLAAAEVSEEDRTDLARRLKRIQDRARSYVAAIGDWRRATGQAVPLCWLPPVPDPLEGVAADS
jgi:hypothetical protein